MHFVTNEAAFVLNRNIVGVIVHFLCFGTKKMDEKKCRKGREITSFPPLDPSRL